MKVAFATSDLVHINAHFGSAKHFAVYDVNKEGYKFLNDFEFGGNLDQDGNEDKLLPKLQALADCTIVYVVAIGGGAAARLINKNVTPIKAGSPEDEITGLLDKLVTTLNGSPPPWLRKALAKDTGNEDRFRDFESDEDE